MCRAACTGGIFDVDPDALYRWTSNTCIQVGGSVLPWYSGASSCIDLEVICISRDPIPRVKYSTYIDIDRLVDVESFKLTL